MIPSLFIREMRVVRLIPMRAAAPVGASDPAFAFGHYANNLVMLLPGVLVLGALALQPSNHLFPTHTPESPQARISVLSRVVAFQTGRLVAVVSRHADRPAIRIE